MPIESSNSGKYLSEIRSSLLKSMCVQHFSSETVERHTKPEVEIRSCDYSVYPPIKHTKSAHEEVLIEPAVNSVRVSIKIKKLDDIDTLLCHKFASFLMQRAEKFIILRKKAVEGYDVSFLVTNQQLTIFMKEKIAEFIITFLEEIDKEISEMKIGLNARARSVSDIFLKNIA